MKTKSKRILAIVLTMALVLGTFAGLFSMKAGAMDLSRTYEVSWDHILTDENNNTFTWYTGLTATNNPYGYALPAQQRSMHDYTVKRQGLTGNSSNWTYDQDYVYAFCIEHGRPIEDETSYKGSTNENHGDKWAAMSESQRKLIQLALTYGYPNAGNLQTAKDANACYAATQLIVWQISFGFRTSATALNDKTYPMAGHSGTMTQQLTANAHLKRYYDAILSSMAKHYVRPSFSGATASSAPTYALNYSGGQYSITLTDTNGVLSEYYGIDAGGVGVSVSGNTMTITSPIPFGNVATISIARALPQSTMTTGFLIWSVPGREGANQDMVTGVTHDPVPAFIRVTAQEQSQPKGSLRIIKTAAGVPTPSGFQFEVRDSGNALIGTYTTNDSGIINIPNLPTGSYSIKEINIPGEFVLEGSNPKTLSVFENSTTAVDFKNIRQQGQITVRKTNSNPAMGDYSLAGAVFEIRSPSGNTLYETITTNGSGVATSGTLWLGDYIVREKTAPDGFLRNPNDFPVTLSAGGTEVIVGTEVTVPNAPQTGRITVRKNNANPAMGSYALAGAVFEIFDGNRTLVDTITTDAGGNAQSKTLKLGYYTIAEKTAPTGYVRNSTDYVIHLAYAGQDVQLAISSVDVPEQPQVGVIHVNKSNGNLSLGDYSLRGAVFEILNSQGTVVDTINTGDDGHAQSKQLPLGSYQVREKNAPIGFIRNPDIFDASLTYAGQDIAVTTATVNVVEQPQPGRINIRKTNSNTAMGDYSLAGAVFDVYSGSTVVDTVTTDAGGQVQSKLLKLGSYTVKERTAPYGFVRNTDTFTANLTYAGQDVDCAFITVNCPERPQTGIIRLAKTNINPAMGDYALTGAVFEVRSAAGTLVDTITTNAQGRAQTKELPLGAYTVTEKTAPYGFVRNKNMFNVALVYAGQDVDITYGDVSVSERSQTGKITVTKRDAGTTTPTTPTEPPQPSTTAPAVIDTTIEPTTITATTEPTTTAVSTTRPNSTIRTTETFNDTAIVDNTVYIPTTTKAATTTTTTPTAAPKPVVRSAANVSSDTAQGDATLNGAVFEVLASDQNTVVDTIYCGTTDKATSKELPLGTYYIKEKVPPVGYTLDIATHRIVIAYGDQDIEVLMLDGTVRNKVIEGQVGIVKHTDLPMEGYDDPQIEQPLEGAVFEVFLKSSGSYAHAKDSERDKLITNENGYALSKKLPYGVYTIKEISAPGDVKLVAPFDVFISREGHIYRFILNDPSYNARVKIVKMDVSTNKVIPAAGTSFKIKNLKTGEWVKQAVWYPTPATIEVFETGPDGTLMLPEPLYSGDYELHEVQAPVGYLISDKPVKFTINSEQQEAVVTVTMKNQPVKGKITVEKQGEMLLDAVEVNTKFGKLLMPLFEMRPLIGAAFDIIAAEDIITPDGTVRAKKGDVVDHIVTGDAGTATSKELFLGNYYAVETKAPTDFVLDKTQHAVSLVYENQHTAIVTSQIGVDNARQKVEINLLKVMEKPIDAPDDYSAFHDVLFGLFAGEDFGGIIPKDALLATITLDENGKGKFEGDLPFGEFYVKELQTNPFYQLNDMVFAIDVPYAGQDVDATKVHVNNGGAIPNELKQGKIVVEKQGEIFVGAAKTENGYTPIYELRGLPGATFEVIAAEDIYDVFGKLVIKKGSVVDTITTGLDGKAESKPLRLGRYEIVETAAPAGFVLDPTRHAVTLGFESEVAEVITENITILNERQSFELQINKSWELPANPPKEFAPWKEITFGLYAKNDVLSADGSVAIPAGALIEVISIDKDGKGAAKTDLPKGEYFIKEIQTSKGYVLDNASHPVVFNDGGKPIVINADNRIQRGSLKIIKRFEGKTTPVEGVPFLVVGQTAFGEVRYEVKTDKNGQVLIKDLPVGTYTITEQKSSVTEGDILSPTRTVTVTMGKEAVVDINNNLASGTIEILKSDTESKKPLEGAMFGLYKDGKLIAQAKSDINGVAVFNDIPFGNYEVRELSAPVGYQRDDSAHKVTIGEGKTQIKLTFTNEKLPGEPILPSEPEKPVPSEPLPKTGDSKTVVVIALVMLILAGGAVLWLRKRGKAEDEPTEETEAEE